MTDITSPHKKDIPVYQTDRAIRSVRSIFCTGFSVAVILQCSLLGSGCSPSTPATTEKNTTAILSTSNELDAATPKITVSIAAASDLKFALEDLSERFQKQNPTIQIKTTYGSSGNFFAQLSNKAPFDLFLSADINYPNRLIEQGDAVKDSLFPYAIGKIVLWIRNDSAIELTDKGFLALTDPSIQKIAIANPQHAPYGRAAEAALKHEKLYHSIQEKLVFGENISQTLQFIETGSADIGIVALSLASAPTVKNKGRFWVIPEETYPKLVQGGVQTTWATNPEACQSLREYLVSPAAAEIFKQYGFESPNQ